MKKHSVKITLPTGAREKWTKIMRGDYESKGLSSAGDPLTMAVATFADGVWAALGVRMDGGPEKSNPKYLWVFDKDNFRDTRVLRLVDGDTDFMADQYEWRTDTDHYVLQVVEKEPKAHKRKDGDIVAEMVVGKKAREAWGGMLMAKSFDENGYAAPEELDKSPIVMGVGEFTDGCFAALAVVKSGVPEYNTFAGWAFTPDGRAIPDYPFNVDEATELGATYQAGIGDDDQNYVVHIVEKKKGGRNSVNFEFSPEADAEKFPEPEAGYIAKYKKDFHGTKFLCLIDTYPSNVGVYYRYLVKNRDSMTSITMHVNSETGAVTHNGNMLIGTGMGTGDSVRDSVMRGSSLPEAAPANLPEPVLGYFNEAAKGKDYIPVKYIGVYDESVYWVICHSGVRACLLKLAKDEGAPVRAQLIQLN